MYRLDELFNLLKIIPKPREKRLRRQYVKKGSAAFGVVEKEE